MIYIVLQLE